MKIFDEVFCVVPNTNERYWASSYGYLWDMKLRHKVPVRKQKRGWFDCKVWFSGERKTINIHRVIMMAFVGNSELSVNHIDGDKSNNRIENLEYMTLEEQNWHRSRVSHAGYQYPVYCIETGDIYPNARVAGEILGIKCPEHISKVINKRYGFKTVHGYHFVKAC